MKPVVDIKSNDWKATALFLHRHSPFEAIHKGWQQVTKQRERNQTTQACVAGVFRKEELHQEQVLRRLPWVTHSLRSPQCRLHGEQLLHCLPWTAAFVVSICLTYTVGHDMQPYSQDAPTARSSVCASTQLSPALRIFLTEEIPSESVGLWDGKSLLIRQYISPTVKDVSYNKCNTLH